MIEGLSDGIELKTQSHTARHIPIADKPISSQFYGSVVSKSKLSAWITGLPFYKVSLLKVFSVELRLRVDDNLVIHIRYRSESKCYFQKRVLNAFVLAFEV